MTKKGRPKGSRDKTPRKKKRSRKKTGRIQAADYIPWDEAKRIINNLYRDEEYIYAMIFVIGIYFGLRISEIRKVKWDDLINQKYLSVQEVKTGRLRYGMPINEHIQKLAYQLYNRLNPETEYIVPPTWHRNTLLFKFKRIKKKYNVPVEHFSTHSLRKTWGRRYMEKNNYSAKALLILNEALGHQNIRDTKIYLGFTQDETRKIYEQLADEPILV